jgi:hypothetical protein
MNGFSFCPSLLNYIAGIKINIKNNVNAIIIIQVTTEIITNVLFLFLIPIVNPKVPTINKSNNIIKINYMPSF